jgi:hypothetical protein
MATFAPNPQDVYALHVFRQVTAELERRSVGIYLTDRTQLVALTTYRLGQSADPGAQECFDSMQCRRRRPPPTCNGGECEVIYLPPPSPLRERRKSKRSERTALSTMIVSRDT